MENKPRNKAILIQIENLQKKIKDMEKNIDRLYELFYQDYNDGNN